MLTYVNIGCEIVSCYPNNFQNGLNYWKLVFYGENCVEAEF